MIEEHKACTHPNDKNVKLWRYYDFSKFADLILNRSLYFARADEFEDIFEGSLPTKSASAREKQVHIVTKEKDGTVSKTRFWNNIGQEFKKRLGISCWHMNNYESAAMWKLYLKTNEGVAIQTTYGRFVESLNKFPNPVYVSIVKYIDYENDIIDWGNRMVPFVHKRLSFSHEHELRAIIRDSDYDLSAGGIKLKVDLDLLIDKVFVAPNAPLWFTNLVKDFLKPYSFEVINSKLADNPIY